MTAVRTGAPRRIAGRRVFAFLLVALAAGGWICAVAWSLQVPAPGAEPGTSPLPAAALVAAVSTILLGLGLLFLRGGRRAS